MWLANGPGINERAMVTSRLAAAPLGLEEEGDDRVKNAQQQGG